MVHQEGDYTLDLLEGVSIGSTPAGGSNENVTLTPSGAGVTVLNGNLRIPAVGTPGAGKVLTASDSSGNATWSSLGLNTLATTALSATIAMPAESFKSAYPSHTSAHFRILRQLSEPIPQDSESYGNVR